jgi:hypothetical protein
VKVLLSKNNTHLFYAGASRWTSNRREALAFSDVEHAIRCHIEQQLDTADILVVYDNPPRTLTLPITSLSPVMPRRRLIPTCALK